MTVHERTAEDYDCDSHNNPKSINICGNIINCGHGHKLVSLVLVSYE